MSGLIRARKKHPVSEGPQGLIQVLRQLTDDAFDLLRDAGEEQTLVFDVYVTDEEDPLREN